MLVALALLMPVRNALMYLQLYMKCINVEDMRKDTRNFLAHQLHPNIYCNSHS